MEDKNTNSKSWYFLSVYMGTVTSLLLDDDDPADFIVAVKITSNYPYSSLGSTTECSLESGVTSTD